MSSRQRMSQPEPPEGDPPAVVGADVDAVAAALEAELPGKRDGNLLVGTWNIRAFARLTDKWQVGEGDSPRRDWHALSCIARVVDRFDVTAIQETRRNTTALLGLLRLLGPHYRTLLSDVTEGTAGNQERLVYVYDSRRVQPSGLVGELVLPDQDGTLRRQFARTPYAAGFRRNGIDVTLTTVHVIWGQDPSDRVAELEHFAWWMREWADRPQDWNDNLLVLGDFNLDRLDDPLFAAFRSTGLQPPEALNGVPRTVFDNDRESHHYDQVAWFVEDPETAAEPLLRGLLPTGLSGTFDFLPHAFADLDRQDVSWRISDHYPLWVEFETEPAS